MRACLKIQSQTDAIIGWVDKAGRPFLMDTWINGYTAPLLDASQDLSNTTGSTVDGVTTLSFMRKRTTGDTKVRCYLRIFMPKTDFISHLCTGYDVYERQVFVFDVHRQRRRLQSGQQENQKTRIGTDVFERPSVHKTVRGR